jgi:ABC-type nickel/cobalt efflux system permease component RcnA
MTMHHRPRHRRRLRALAALAGLCAAFAIPALAAAHPLGNFTINHYAGVRVEPDRVLLDIVVDQAEIPTFQARLGFDTDGDGEVSDAETDAGRATACASLQPSLALTVDGGRRTLALDEAGLTFPNGVGGLNTMRIVCEFSASLDAPLAAGTRVDFTDSSFVDRLGWREIVASGSGVTLAAAKAGVPIRTATTSDRLRTYPTNLLTQALDDKTVSLVVTPGGPTLPTLDVADATPLAGSGGAAIARASSRPVTPVATAPSVEAAGPAPAPGSVPGGVTGGELPSIFRSSDLSPIVLLVSVLTAGALGAGHALTPGHGKTLMAAYLVGTRGTPLHAAGLGLSVTVSHTLGILVLAAVVVGAQGFLPPDTVVRSAPVIAAISIVAIGGWMLVGEGRRRWRARATAAAVGPDHLHVHNHAPDHDHAHGDHHDHDRGADQTHAADHTDVANAAVPGEHSHGGVTHSHLPPAGSTISWRSLFVLGLAGGLIPSTSALLILLGSIAAGRPAFGFVLVVAFGLGMALVMGGIGLALVLARGRLDRVDAGSPLGRASGFVPLAAAVLVFGLGLYLTVQAVSGSATF